MTRGLKVLLCDDSRLALMKLSKVFEELGCQVVSMHQTGEEALAAYRSDPGGYDLVTLDLVMPGMDGLEVLAELRRLDPAAKVLILSSIVQPEIEAKARSLGAVGILEKPYDPPRIKAAIETFMGNSS